LALKIKKKLDVNNYSLPNLP